MIVDMDQPSYMMLMLPASKVSVPLTVVMRIRSSTPPRLTPPAPKREDGPPFDVIVWFEIQLFAVIFVSVIVPFKRSAATNDSIIKPAVEDEVVEPVVEAVPELVYPVVVKVVEPI